MEEAESQVANETVCISFIFCWWSLYPSSTLRVAFFCVVLYVCVFYIGQSIQTFLSLCMRFFTFLASLLLSILYIIYILFRRTESYGRSMDRYGSSRESFREKSTRKDVLQQQFANARGLGMNDFTSSIHVSLSFSLYLSLFFLLSILCYWLVLCVICTENPISNALG